MSTTLPGEHARLIDDWIDYLRRYVDSGDPNDIARLTTEYPKESTSLYVSYRDLTRGTSAEFADRVLKNPATMLDLASEAVADYDTPVDVDLTGVDVRFTDIEAVPDGHRTQVGGLRTEHKNQLVAIEGQVKKRATAKGQWTETAFECQRCGTITRVPHQSSYQEPHECKGCERDGPFDIDEQQSDSRDYQLVRLQQPPEQAVGATTAEIDIVFADDLVNAVRPGDRVTVLTELWTEMADEDSGTFTLVGEANNVRHHETDFKDISIDAEDEERIKQRANDTPFADLRESIKPSHYGHETEKLAIGLQLFGGTWKTGRDGDRTRGSIHIILVGDPGADKTGLLEYAEELSPRGIFTSGKNTTGAGLTAAAVNDDFGDEGWTLEGGALVQADGGLAAIDEFDKIDENEVEAMHEALSRGRVSPSKAGMDNVRLPAETAVLAAGNPTHGRWDDYEPASDQISIEPAMLSRFDLIFTIKDTVDAETDEELAEHLLESHRASQRNERGEPVEADGQAPAVDPELLRKWIAYAREELSPPELTPEAKARLKEFYTTARSWGEEASDAVPVTARKLDALVRLSEASARVRLSEDITEGDAERAIRMVTKTMNDVGIDPETGEYDADVVETGTSQAQRDRVKSIKGIVADLAQKNDQGAPRDEVLEVAVDSGMSQSKVEHNLDKLCHQGELYQPQSDYYRTT